MAPFRAGNSAELADAIAGDIKNGARMRRLLTFACEGDDLAASLDEARGDRPGPGHGGSQTRVGSHRMYERLGKALADKGFTCLRFDRRGVGDSAGEDPGFRGSGPDLAAAGTALRRRMPGR